LLFLFLAFISKGAIGGGDIKLIAALGLWLGIKALLTVIIYGSVAGGIAALFLLLLKKTTRKQFLAYGPYFALSAIGVLLKILRVSF
jgi:Type IV leader peptidase family.